MKKSGFTLAEVLVTLGIVGVISALTIPTFISNMQGQKTGPMLGKAVESFNDATRAMLHDAETSALTLARVDVSDAGDGSDMKNLSTKDEFLDALEAYLKGSKDETNKTKFTTEDGLEYEFVCGDEDTDFSTDVTTKFPGKGVVCNKVKIDVDGAKGTGQDGKDVFYFELMNDGSLLAWGASRDTVKDHKAWTTEKEGCPRFTGSNQVNNKGAQYCAGHVMENGLKLEYKLSGSDE